jgi:hypothetical protein
MLNDRDEAVNLFVGQDLLLAIESKCTLPGQVLAYISRFHVFSYRIKNPGQAAA